jgi:hypothetical protein
MPERKLIADESIKGYVCDVCGWAWPTSMLFVGSPPEQTMLRAFYAHDCSDYPPPRPKLPAMKPE